MDTTATKSAFALSRWRRTLSTHGKFCLAIAAVAIAATTPAMALPVTGWVTGRLGAVAHTTDGGGTPWNSQTSSVNIELTRVDAVDALNAWAVGEQGRIVHTANGGSTWTTQTNVVPALQANDILRGVDFIDANSGWTVGRRVGAPIIGVIARTTDGGTSWTSQTIGSDESLVDVDFHPGSTTGWVVGGQIAGTASVIRKTTDGTNWSAPISLPGPIANGILNGVDFSDLLTGWAVGSAGKILKSTDGGASWNAQISGTTFDLGAVNFFDSQTGWATSVTGGQILRTVDGGANWAQTNISSSSNTITVLRDIAFADANSGWAVGSVLNFSTSSSSSLLLYSGDGGVSWTPQTTTLPPSVLLLSGVAVVPPSVPEPTSLLLFGLVAIACSSCRIR